jgi:hypothetical protein
VEDKELFLVDLILSGELDKMATRYSWRIAAQAAGNSEENDAEIVAEARSGLLLRSKLDAVTVIEWLAQLGRDPLWWEDLLAAEAAYQCSTASLVTEKNLERELRSLQLMLTRFEIETVEVDSRDAAAELLACVRTDGMEMAEVAEESRYPLHRQEVLLEDITPAQQQNFLSVKAGAVLGPIPRGDAFEVCRVKTRVEPSLHDATIRARLEKRIVERHFAELVSKFIDWKLFQPGNE